MRLSLLPDKTSLLMAAGQFDSTVGMLVQARMSSTRLPGKVLMPMPFGSSQSILAGIVHSLQSTGAKVIVASSENSENDPVERFCQEYGVSCFRGSEDDVFSRFLAIQKKESFKTVFRFTADNPFIDLSKLSQFYRRFLDSKVEYAYSKGMPLGMNFEVMKGHLLMELASLELSSEEREHVTLRIHRDDRFSKKLISIAEASNLRMTVDTPIDYAQASLLKLKLGDDCSLESILHLKTQHPWLFELNHGVLQKNTSDKAEEQIEIIKKLSLETGYTKVFNLLDSLNNGSISTVSKPN